MDTPMQKGPWDIDSKTESGESARVLWREIDVKLVLSGAGKEVRKAARTFCLPKT
jgi:hypothetical protein